MTLNGPPPALLDRLAVVRRLCPEMRFGQLVATIGLLAEDETGRNLWDVEDQEFAAALERLAADLWRRQQNQAQPGAGAARGGDGG
jgi:hypothetical protein